MSPIETDQWHTLLITAVQIVETVVDVERVEASKLEMKWCENDDRRSSTAAAPDANLANQGQTPGIFDWRRDT